VINFFFYHLFSNQSNNSFEKIIIQKPSDDMICC
jgi:hypothetical protein